MTATRRLAAILAADVAGYSRLMGADEEGTHERLKAHLQELRKDAGLIHPYRQAGERQPSGDGHREIATHLRDAKSGVLAPPETGAVDPPLQSRDALDRYDRSRLLSDVAAGRGAEGHPDEVR